jgi:hypothetical protein
MNTYRLKVPLVTVATVEVRATSLPKAKQLLKAHEPSRLVADAIHLGPQRVFEPLPDCELSMHEARMSEADRRHPYAVAVVCLKPGFRKEGLRLTVAMLSAFEAAQIEDEINRRPDWACQVAIMDAQHSLAQIIGLEALRGKIAHAFSKAAADDDEVGGPAMNIPVAGKLVSSQGNKLVLETYPEDGEPSQKIAVTTTGKTKVTIDDAQAAAADLKPGMDVEVLRVGDQATQIVADMP